MFGYLNNVCYICVTMIETKQILPIRIHPDLIKQIKRQAAKNGKRVSPFVEELLHKSLTQPKSKKL